ncbi:MAG TPA: sigma-54 dependent transcriptional regulator [Polyangia bacterium]
MSRLLVVDDEETFPRLVKALLGEQHTIDVVKGALEALTRLDEVAYDAVLTDLHLPPGPDGIELIRRARERDLDVPFVMLTGHATVETAVDAMREGAFDYLRKTASGDELRAAVGRALAHGRMAREVKRLRGEVAQARGVPDRPVGQSERMREVLALAERVAPSEASVLILGESGTGKELLARVIHRSSARRDGPFVAFDCSALAPSLVESELFGHEKGAFTGAVARRPGRFELADGGTLFLDECGDIPMEVQVKLLRVLQERELERVGGTETVRVDVRVDSATHRDLEALIAEGRFREDLYYRLNVFPITLPPLRDRLDDLPRLVEHFVAKFNRVTGKTVRGFDPSAIVAMQQYSWPGNVRELENVVERAIIISRGSEVTAADLDFGRRAQVQGASPTPVPAVAPAGRPLQARLQEQEKNEIVAAIERNQGNIAGAARALGINRSTLYYRLRKHGLEHLLPTKPSDEPPPASVPGVPPSTAEE